jgi:hypothetical protein
MDKSQQQALFSICQKIHEDGQKPTVSIVRAKAPFRVSLAEAITAVKMFKPGPTINKEGELVSDEGTLSSETMNAQRCATSDKNMTTIVQMEKRIVQLENALAALEKRVAMHGI